MTHADPLARPPMSFISNDLDRCSGKRSDAAWLAAHLDAPDAGIVLSTSQKLVLRETPGGLNMRHTLGEALALGAQRDEMIFLGLDPAGKRPLFATAIPKSDEEIEVAEGIAGIDLRTLAVQGSLPDEDLGALAQARSMIHWHRTHKFCSCCGQPTRLAEAGYRRDCTSCGASHFPRTDPCVIMLIIHGDKVLLGRPPRLAEDIYTTLAGFMEPGETVEQAVQRETMEESAIKVGDVKILSNQPWPFPANLMIGCIGEALSTEINYEDDELEACKWCDRDEVRQMLAGTHPEGHHVPPSISIAYQLITAWLDGRVSLSAP